MHQQYSTMQTLLCLLTSLCCLHACLVTSVTISSRTMPATVCAARQDCRHTPYVSGDMSAAVNNISTTPNPQRTCLDRVLRYIVGNTFKTHTVCCAAGTCILFGDGCGAVLVSAAPDGESCSLLGVDMHSDGKGHKSLYSMYSGCGGKPFHVRRSLYIVLLHSLCQ